ncbi:Cation diffusion facilitator family transporter [Luteimonas sp. 9C]|uniref:cation transporter n=1 Tax=Luteimonas sp. 9C TaxID=2653148 RepID=UPI0012F2CA6B|nr:cation transporter [Luteimonas sp. 9C]VXB00245.1 Cation diffusion facilitator family transporter [Luteimonas sp. 9C]
MSEARATPVRRRPRPLGAAQLRDLQRAARLCWWSIALLGAITVMMFLTMGGSQAMLTALVEDVLSLLPPIAFLIALRFRTRGVDATYVDGRERAFDITFLASSVALTAVGLLLVVDGLHVLATRTHPVVGSIAIGDAVVWQGWVMIAALAVSCVPPVILGRMKLKLARALDSKPLHTDADMNKADWMTAVAGIVGVLGIGFGLWWADAAAAVFIAFEVLRDGVRNLRNAVRDLHDARPQRVDRSDHDTLPDQVVEAVSRHPDVAACRVRFHEEGLRLSGVVYATPRAGALTAAAAQAIRETARAVHWRIDEVHVVPDGADAPDGDTSSSRG